MHAELIAHQVPGAALGAVYDAYRAGGARRRGRARRARGANVRGDLRLRARRGRDLLELRYPRRSADRGGAGGQGGVLREAGVAGSIGGRPRARRDRRRRACRSRSASTAGSTRRTPRFARPWCRARWASRTWCGSRAATPSRRRSSTSRVGRPVPRHDDPRLRHGQVRHRQRGRRGVRARRAPDRALVRGGRRHRHRAGDARARGRMPDRDRQLAPRRVRIRPASRGVRVRGDGGVREPARAHRERVDRGRRAATPEPVLLPRALPAELRARVGGVRRGGEAGRRPAGVDGRRARLRW